MIVVVDYKSGNLGSIQNMLKKIGATATVSSDPKDILRADHLILPGVGAFDQVRQNLDQSGILPLIQKKVLEDKTPVLGLCVGMQLMLEKSEEGQLPGLGWIPGRLVRFRTNEMDKPRPIPHMGWNLVQGRSPEGLFRQADPLMRFYFVHSFHIDQCPPEYVAATVRYGYEFACAVHKENIWGVQFHPEKSHRFGMELFKNFVHGGF